MDLSIAVLIKLSLKFGDKGNKNKYFYITFRANKVIQMN